MDLRQFDRVDNAAARFLYEQNGRVLKAVATKGPKEAFCQLEREVLFYRYRKLCSLRCRNP
jgi:hypothetical protein